MSRSTITAEWLNENSRTFLSRDYLKEGVSPEDRIWQISKAAEDYLGIDGFAEKFENYMLKGWISLSSPVWANFGLERGLPISCFGSYMPDDTVGIMRKNSEIALMTKHGGGTSAYYGDLRARGSNVSDGGKSDGPVSFLEITQAVINTISQSSVRRGHCAIYLPVTHPDIKEYLEIRGEGHTIQKLSFGVTIPDDWMEEMIAGDKEKKKIWTKIIQKRYETGFPYVIFSDNVNNQKPQWYKNANKIIHQSNMCTEIFLPNSLIESFVCCLSSLNLVKWFEWKDTDLVETVIFFLDAVMEEFIKKARHIPYLEDAVRFAENHRALGLGVLGWHSLLQSQMVSFESLEAKKLNVEIFQNIGEKADEASRKLAKLFGEPEVTKGYGRRNSTVMAIAPTTSSSFILGQISPSIEPENSNYFVKDLAKGKFTQKNRYLEQLLEEKDKNTPAIWKDILTHGGSVQHLDFLDENEKTVFKTFGEIPQIEIITQAALRQPFIDQGQSMNITIHPKASPKDTSKLMIEGWKLGVKSFYYQLSTNPSQEFVRELMSCSACEA